MNLDAVTTFFPKKVVAGTEAAPAPDPFKLNYNTHTHRDRPNSVLNSNLDSNDIVETKKETG